MTNHEPEQARLVLLDRPTGPDCTLCGLPRLIALADDVLLCIRCDRWPQREQLLAAIRAECGCQQ